MWGFFLKALKQTSPLPWAGLLQGLFMETIEVNEDLFKELQEAVPQDEATTQEIDVEVVNTSKEENHHKKRVEERQHNTTLLRPNIKQ